MLSRRIIASTSGLIAQCGGLRHKYVASSYEQPENAADNEANKGTASTGAASNTASNSTASSSSSSATSSSNTSKTTEGNDPTKKPEEEEKKTPEQIKEDFIAELIKRDKELFELKRQHELSMLRVEQHQNRILQDQHDRGIYYEQTVNVHTFETITVGQYTQRNTLHHVIGLQKLRNFKIQMAIAATVYAWAFIIYRYVVNPDMTYVSEGMRKIGDSSVLRRAHREAEKNAAFEKFKNGEEDDGDNVAAATTPESAPKAN